MEILIRSIALAGGVHVPPEVNILPPRQRRQGRPLRVLLGRALKGLGAIASRAGHWLADEVEDYRPPTGVHCRT